MGRVDCYVLYLEIENLIKKKKKKKTMPEKRLSQKSYRNDLEKDQDGHSCNKAFGL